MGNIRAFGDLRLVDDVSAADWIVSSVRNFQHDVGSLLPVTFEAYARVLHPALRDSTGGDEVEVTWADVAAANGRVAHAGMEWVAITGDWTFMTQGGQAGLWDHPPSIGSLPQRTATTLADVLQRFTQDPSDCWFAVWDGYGNDPFPPGTVPLIAMPHRAMALLRGPLSAAGLDFSSRRWPESASLWWPGDRAWCVATDIDLMSTYVGGTRACIDAVLADESTRCLRNQRRPERALAGRHHQPDSRSAASACYELSAATNSSWRYPRAIRMPYSGFCFVASVAVSSQPSPSIPRISPAATRR